MSREQKVLRRQLRDPELRNWVRKNEQWFASNPAALKSLIQNPEMLSAMQARLESKKNKISRKIARAGGRAVSGNQSPAKRKPLFRIPKLSLSNLNLEDATEKISRAAEMVETIRNLTGLLGKK